MLLRVINYAPCVLILANYYHDVIVSMVECKVDIILVIAMYWGCSKHLDGCHCAAREEGNNILLFSVPLSECM